MEYIPLRDYYHRHSRSIFWEMQYLVPFGNTKIFRYLLGWLMPLNILLLRKTRTEKFRQYYEKNHVLQDMLVPQSEFLNAINCFETNISSKDPTWLCPFRIFQDDIGLIKPTKNGEEYFVDIGIYGKPMAKNYHYIKSLKNIEEFVLNTEGYQMLYADSYLTKE